jgi:hypothetical protein
MAFALSCAWPMAAAGQEPGRVVGVVRAADTGEPVEGAAVRLAGADVVVAETVTGPGGSFALEAIPPGEYVLGVRRIGFAAYSVPLEVGPDGLAPIDVRLSLDPVELEPLEVDVEGRPLRLVETGFYDRLEDGWGTYFEPEWIRTRRAGFIRLTDFVSNLQMRAPLSRCPKVPVYYDRRLIGEVDGWGTSRPRSINSAGTAPVRHRAARAAGGPIVRDGPGRCRVVSYLISHSAIRSQRHHDQLRRHHPVVRLDGADGESSPADRSEAL